MGIVGGREIFDRMLRNQWLKPRIKQRKLVRYAAEDLMAAVERLKLEGIARMILLDLETLSQSGHVSAAGVHSDPR